VALTVEDGTVVAGADSYVSLAAAATYATNHGNTTFAALASDALREAALRYATTWVDNRYSWPGTIVDDDQALNWPRGGAYDAQGRGIDSDEIPQALKDAVCEAAFAHVTATLAEVLDRGGMTTSEKVGPVEVTYSTVAPPSRTFPFIDSIVSRIVGSWTPGIAVLVR
jgi:hypothetical protein